MNTRRGERCRTMFDGARPRCAPRVVAGNQRGSARISRTFSHVDGLFRLEMFRRGLVALRYMMGLRTARRTRTVVMLLRGHDGRDRMLENQLLLMIRLKDYAVFIEAFDTSGKLHTASKVDRNRHSFFAGVVKKAVLKVLT